MARMEVKQWQNENGVVEKPNMVNPHENLEGRATEKK
jgi:hypothetical protein